MTDQTGYTRVPNALLECLATLPPAETRVLLAIIRKTTGWQKAADVIRYTQLEAATGMSRQGVINGVEGAIKRGMLKRTPAKNNGFVYEVVNEVDHSEPQVVNAVDQSTSLTSLQSRPLVVNEVDHSEPQVVNEVDTQKKDLKEKERKSPRVQPHPPRPPTPIPKSQATLSFAHEGVTAYKELAEVHKLEAVKADKIAEIVTDIPAWRCAVQAWIAAGNRKENVTGMLDWYIHPERQKGRTNGRHVRQSPGRDFERATWTEDG